jgi:hypothetical protein
LFLGFEHFVTAFSWLCRVLASMNTSWPSLGTSPHNPDDTPNTNTIPTDETLDEMHLLHIPPPQCAFNSSVSENLQSLVHDLDYNMVAIVLYSPFAKEHSKQKAEVPVGMISLIIFGAFIFIVIFIFICICIYLYLYLFVFVFICICIYFYLYLFVFIFICIYFY